MSNLAKFIEEFVTTNGVMIGKAVIIAGIIIAGVGLALTKRTREWAKEHILWLIVSAVLILGAATYANELFDELDFGSESEEMTWDEEIREITEIAV